ncbi:MAG: Nramp family divalent metal transporter [Burkholderiaceae bacterium]
MTPPPPIDSATADAGLPPHAVGPLPLPPGRWLRRLLGFMGPGYLVAVGYMDPGNWATDLAAGSGFGYALLWVIMLSNLMAILLQVLAIRLGVVTGLDLAQACRANSSRLSGLLQWFLCEIAICACDLAEVIGSAIALNLLFHIPLPWGVALTALDVLLVFWLQGRGMRYLEAMIIALLTLIFCCFAITLAMAQPDWADVAAGLVPTPQALVHPEMLYLAIGIIGATVMPHNLYLHSSIVQHRARGPGVAGKREAIRFATIDVVIALFFAFLVNAAILVVSGEVFHERGHTRVAEIQDAHRLLSPMLGSAIASTLFALALLASGQSSTITATMAGQIVMEGFLQWRMKPWMRRLVTRSAAIVPALLAAAWYGESGVARLLVLSQVILSLQLPFAIVPLIRFTSSSQMGAFVNPRWLTLLASAVALLIIALNLTMLFNLGSELLFR